MSKELPIDIDRAFSSAQMDLYGVFKEDNLGYYIPLYQRQYSWDEDNVTQLLDDIARGVHALCDDGEEEIKFLGTIITVTERHRENIQPQDVNGLPKIIESVIDGQQRISTVALFACQIYASIIFYERKLEKLGDEYRDIIEACSNWRDKLRNIFALDLKRGNPRIKPRIIRGEIDKWVKEGDISDAYTSPIANYIARFIDYVIAVEAGNDISPPSFSEYETIGPIIKSIKKWLDETVSKAHMKADDEEYPAAKTILDKVAENHIWEVKREVEKKIVLSYDDKGNKSAGEYLSSLVQIFSASHYLLERCCFTVIQPYNEKWAFDLFQSLNATGTPLTAIETFRPLVVNNFDKLGGKFKGSKDDYHFSLVEKLFSGIKNAGIKNKLTSDFLTSFALVVDAEQQKMSSQFSVQRKWLERIYSDKDFTMQNAFVKTFGLYADFYKRLWMNYKADDILPIEGFSKNKDAALASLLFMYLKDSNHRMAITIIARFYIKLENASSENKIQAIDDLIQVIKIIASFYTIWRSAQSNSGLDAVYRSFFRGEKDESGNLIKTFAWIQSYPHYEPTVEDVRNHFISALSKYGLDDKNTWIKKASTNVNYKSKHGIKLLLLIAAHDTIPDKANLGLMKIGVEGVSEYLSYKNWKSKYLDTVEHVAPLSKTDSWDAGIYDEDLENSLGNLIMLPLSVNISASNKGWIEKLIYYKHLGETDVDKLHALKQVATDNGVNLTDSITEVLRNGKHQPHILPILNLEGGEWNKYFILSRTDRILEIAWVRLNDWIEGLK